MLSPSMMKEKLKGLMSSTTTLLCSSSKCTTNTGDDVVSDNTSTLLLVKIVIILLLILSIGTIVTVFVYNNGDGDGGDKAGDGDGHEVSSDNALLLRLLNQGFFTKSMCIYILKRVSIVLLSFAFIKIMFRVLQRAKLSPTYELPQYDCYDENVYAALKKRYNKDELFVKEENGDMDKSHHVEIRGWRFPFLKWTGKSLEHRWVTYSGPQHDKNGADVVDPLSCFDPDNANDPNLYDITDRDSYGVRSGCILYQKHAIALRDLLKKIFSGRDGHIDKGSIVDDGDGRDLSSPKVALRMVNNSVYALLVQLFSHHSLMEAAHFHGSDRSSNDQERIENLVERIDKSSTWNQLKNDEGKPWHKKRVMDILRERLNGNNADAQSGLFHSLQCIAPMYSTVGTFRHGITEHREKE